MKKLLLIAVGILSAVSAYAQGTVLFNTKTAGVDAPVKLADGTMAKGPTYVGQLYAGAGNNATSLSAIGTAVPFRSDAGAGYITAGGTITVPGVAGGGAATIQLRAWNSTQGSFDAATEKGSSASINLTLGGAGSPPGLPANLTGLQGFSLSGSTPVIPEPSTIALAALGGAAALFLRRRK